MDTEGPKVKFAGIIKFPQEGFSNRRNTDVAGLKKALENKNVNDTIHLTLTRKVDGVATLVVAFITPQSDAVDNAFEKLIDKNKVIDNWPWDSDSINNRIDELSRDGPWQRKALRAFLLPHTMWSLRTFAGGQQYYINISLYSATEKSLQIPHYLRRGIEDYICNFYGSVLTSNGGLKAKALRAEHLQCLAFRTELIVGKAEPSAATTFLGKNRRLRSSDVSGFSPLSWPSLLYHLKAKHFAKEVMEAKWRAKFLRQKRRFDALGLAHDDPTSYSMVFIIRKAKWKIIDLKESLKTSLEIPTGLIEVKDEGQKRTVSVYADSESSANHYRDLIQELIDEPENDIELFDSSIKPTVKTTPRNEHPDDADEQIDKLRAGSEETLDKILHNNVSNARSHRRKGFEKVYGFLGFCIEAAWNASPIINMDAAHDEPEMSLQQLGVVVLDLHVGADIQQEWLAQAIKSREIPEQFQKLSHTERNKNQEIITNDSDPNKYDKDRYHSRYRFLRNKTKQNDDALQDEMMHTVRPAIIGTEATTIFPPYKPVGEAQHQANNYCIRVEAALRTYVREENGEGFMIVQDITKEAGSKTTQYFKLKDFVLMPVFPQSYMTAFGFWDEIDDENGVTNKPLTPQPENNKFLDFMAHINNGHFYTVKNLKPFTRNSNSTWLRPKTLKPSGRDDTPYEPFILTMSPWGVFKNVNGLASIGGLDSTWLSDNIHTSPEVFGKVEDYLLWVQYVRSCRIRLMCTPVTNGTDSAMKSNNRKRITRVYDDINTASNDALKKYMMKGAQEKQSAMLLQLFGIAKLTKLAYDGMNTDLSNSNDIFHRCGQIVRQLCHNHFVSKLADKGRYHYAKQQFKYLCDIETNAPLTQRTVLNSNAMKLFNLTITEDDFANKARLVFKKVDQHDTLNETMKLKCLQEVTLSSYASITKNNKCAQRMQHVLNQMNLPSSQAYHDWSVTNLPSLPYDILSNDLMQWFLSEMSDEEFQTKVLSREALSYIHDVFTDEAFKKQIGALRKMQNINKGTYTQDFHITTIPVRLIFNESILANPDAKFDPDVYKRFIQYFKIDYATKICQDCHTMADKLRLGEDCRLLVAHIVQSGVNSSVRSEPWRSLDTATQLKSLSENYITSLADAEKEFAFFTYHRDDQDVHLKLHKDFEALLLEKIKYDNEWGEVETSTENHDEFETPLQDDSQDEAITRYGVSDLQVNNDGQIQFVDPFGFEVESMDDDYVQDMFNVTAGNSGSSGDRSDPLAVNTYDVPQEQLEAIQERYQVYTAIQPAINAIDLDDVNGSDAQGAASGYGDRWSSDGVSARTLADSRRSGMPIARAIPEDSKPETKFVKYCIQMHRLSKHNTITLAEFLRRHMTKFQNLRKLAHKFAQVKT